MLILGCSGEEPLHPAVFSVGRRVATGSNFAELCVMVSIEPFAPLVAAPGVRGRCEPSGTEPAALPDTGRASTIEMTVKRQDAGVAATTTADAAVPDAADNPKGCK